MQDLIITIGHNVNGRPTWSEADVLERAADVLALEAFTAYPCAGMWRGEREESTRLEILALDNAEAERIVEAVPCLARALEQAEIALEARPSRVRFVKTA